MHIFSHKISISVKLKNLKKESRFIIDGAVQRKIFGSYSQYLEDIFIDSIFRGKAAGTYIDIGANDPSELSNTKRFYERGWSGVNVEPHVTMYKKLCQERPRDINLNLGIGKLAENLTFYELAPNTLSTFNKKSALHSIKKEGAKIVSETTVKVISLAELLKTTVLDKQVDFLSLDAEGYEHEILLSNDWKSYRPIAIIVELNQDKKGKIIHLLKSGGYVLVYYNGTNGIFVDGNSREIKSIMLS
jgi:FkbM family methyltransferase